MVLVANNRCTEKYLAAVGHGCTLPSGRGRPLAFYVSTGLAVVAPSASFLHGQRYTPGLGGKSLVTFARVDSWRFNLRIYARLIGLVRPLWTAALGTVICLA